MTRGLSPFASPHLRPAPRGTARDAARAAAHVSAAAREPGACLGMYIDREGKMRNACRERPARVEASPTHHPLSGLYTPPPPPIARADPYIVNERAGVYAGAMPPDMSATAAVREEARQTAVYHKTPFRGALRDAVSTE